MMQCEVLDGSASPKVHQHNGHHQDQTSRTSCTFSDSWDIYTEAHDDDGGVDIHPLLQPLFGLGFLPFSTAIQEEEIVVSPLGVPRSVEIAAGEPFIAQTDESDDTQSSTKSLHRVLSPPPEPRETAELQELLIASGKKKKTGKRFKAAARAVLQRVKSGRKQPPVDGSLRQKTGRWNKEKANELVVDTTTPNDEHSKWVSPTATAATDATISPISCDVNDPENTGLCAQTQRLRQKAEEQETRLKSTHAQIEGLQSQLSMSISRYQEQLAQLQLTQEQLAQLAAETHLTAGKEVYNEAKSRALKRSESGTFMRVHDLDLSGSLRGSEESESMSSLSQSGHGVQRPSQIGVPTPDFLLMDHYLLEIIHQLMGLGFDLATDETDRFTPTRDTAKLVSNMPSSAKIVRNGWPVQPWTSAWDHNVLVWTGRVNHDGFGHTWPVVKGRAILHTSAKNVLDYMWDSSLVPKYNPHCQGRSDLYTLQDDVHTTETQSPYGFAGCAKIVRSLNKHRLLPKAIEMKILMYARPLKQHDGSFILVSRSVWENDSATLDSQTAKSVIRTEMLLGCSIMRAIDENTCELTQMSHVHSPGVPEMLAKKAAPGQCHNLMKTLQSLFE